MKSNHPKHEPQTPEMEAVRDEVIRYIRYLDPSKEMVFTRAFNGCSLRKAITSMCLDCRMCETQDIRNCQYYGCTLWNVRPYQNIQSEKAKSSEDEAEVSNGRKPMD